MYSSRSTYELDEKQKLSNLLMYARHARATDPRDKIYALVDLSEDFQELDRNAFSYRTPIAEVYRSWTVAILNAEMDLDLFSAIGKDVPERSDVEQSWVPDWQDAPQKERKQATKTPLAHFSAAGTSILSEPTSQDVHVLALRGLIIDSVKAVGRPLGMGPAADTSISSKLGGVEDYAVLHTLAR